MPYETFISISLTAVTVVLAALALLIAILALWGYKAIKDEANKIADASAKKMIAEYMDSQSIQDKLKEEIQKRVAEEADKLFADIDMGKAFPQSKEDGLQLPGSRDFPEEPTK